VFGYGSGGAESILAWVKMALDIGIQAAALFDGDGPGLTAFDKARQAFGQNPNVLLKVLPTGDIRDKHKLAANCRDGLPEIEKEGVFTRDWKIKAGHEDWFKSFLKEVNTFLRRGWVTPPSPFRAA
jgi:hypothetical protein